MELNRKLIIENATIITMDPSRSIINNGYIVVVGDRIVEVGSMSNIRPEAADEHTEILDARRMIALPGLIDTHGHAGHSIVKTIAEHLDGGWVSNAERIYYQYSTPSFWYADAMLANLERIKYGTTCGFSMLGTGPRCDDAIYSEQHMKGHGKIGGRNILGIGPPNPPWPKKFARWDDSGHKVVSEADVGLEQALKVTEEVVKEWRADPAASRLTVQVAPSKVGVLDGLDERQTRAQYDELKRIAQDQGVMINSHATRGDVAFAYSKLDILGPNVMLAHCNGIGMDEVRILAETQACVSHGPSTRAYQRAGCPVMELIDAGCRVVFSTDGAGPDRTYDLFKEMRTGAILQRARFHKTNLIPPGKALSMVTIDAAAGLGLGHLLGSIEAGKKADIILVNAEQAHMYPRIQPLHRIVYAASGQDVDTVIIDGEVVMKARQMVSVDESEVLAMANDECLRAIDRAGLTDELLMPKGIWDKY